MSRRLFFAIILMFGVGAIVFVMVGRGFMSGDDAPKRVTQGKANIGGPFDLLDKDGNPVSHMDYRGKYMIIYFGYTFCPDVCPTSLGEISTALDLLSEDERKKIVPIFISVDPERDTPAVVGDYVKHFHSQMVGLTGSLAGVKAVAKSYKAYFSKGEPDEDGDYSVDHTSYTYVMGPDGQFVTAYRHATPGADMAKSLKGLF